MRRSGEWMHFGSDAYLRKLTVYGSMAWEDTDVELSSCAHAACAPFGGPVALIPELNQSSVEIYSADGTMIGQHTLPSDAGRAVKIGWTLEEKLFVVDSKNSVLAYTPEPAHKVGTGARPTTTGGKSHTSASAFRTIDRGSGEYCACAEVNSAGAFIVTDTAAGLELTAVLAQERREPVVLKYSDFSTAPFLDLELTSVSTLAVLPDRFTDCDATLCYVGGSAKVIPGAQQSPGRHGSPSRPSSRPVNCVVAVAISLMTDEIEATELAAEFDAAVLSVAVSPDGQRVAVFLEGGGVYVLTSDLSETIYTLSLMVHQTPKGFHWVGNTYLHVVFDSRDVNEGDPYDTSQFSLLFPADPSLLPPAQRAAAAAGGAMSLTAEALAANHGSAGGPSHRADNHHNADGTASAGDGKGAKTNEFQCCPTHEVVRWDLDGSGAIVCATEVDGLRVITESGNYLIEVVPKPLAMVFRLDAKTLTSRLCHAALDCAAAKVDGITALRAVAKEIAYGKDKLDSDDERTAAARRQQQRRESHNTNTNDCSVDGDVVPTIRGSIEEILNVILEAATYEIDPASQEQVLTWHSIIRSLVSNAEVASPSGKDNAVDAVQRLRLLNWLRYGADIGGDNGASNTNDGADQIALKSPRSGAAATSPLNAGGAGNGSFGNRFSIGAPANASGSFSKKPKSISFTAGEGEDDFFNGTGRQAPALASGWWGLTRTGGRGPALAISMRQYQALCGTDEFRLHPREGQVLIDRLVQRREFQWALRTASFLRMRTDKILTQWSVMRVASVGISEEDLARDIIDVLRNGPTQAALVDAALAAVAVGKHDLALRLLNAEQRAQESVLLLLQMGQDDVAMEKAIAASDADLIQLVLLKLMNDDNEPLFFSTLSRHALSEVAFLLAAKNSKHGIVPSSNAPPTNASTNAADATANSFASATSPQSSTSFTYLAKAYMKATHQDRNTAMMKLVQCFVDAKEEQLSNVFDEMEQDAADGNESGAHGKNGSGKKDGHASDDNEGHHSDRADHPPVKQPRLVKGAATATLAEGFTVSLPLELRRVEGTQAVTEATMAECADMFQSAAAVAQSEHVGPHGGGGAGAAAPVSAASCDAEAKACTVHQQLLKVQEGMMSSGFAGPEIYNKSVMQTIRALVMVAEVDEADKLKVQFKVPDKKYWFCKLQALCDSVQWEEVEKMGGTGRFKTTKSPIGWLPFVEILAEAGQQDRAAKFVARLPTLVERVEWYVRLDHFQRAIDDAFEEDAAEVIKQIRTRARNPSILQYIDKRLAEM